MPVNHSNTPTLPGEQNQEAGALIGDLLPGVVLAGRYEIENAIAQGGHGAVYKARQLDLDRDVAIKVLRPGTNPSKKQIERFRREAIATGHLRHPNIVTVHDFGALPNGSRYLVMEYLAGPTLDELIRTRGAIVPDRAAVLMHYICEGVQAAHAKGIVHRDLKPSNIIFTGPDACAETVKVADFGVARFASSDGTLTGNARLGTPAYMASEVAAGLPADQRSDIYSLGAIAYEMVAGRPVFAGPTIQSVLFQHLSKKPQPLAGFVAGVPQAFDAAILKALDKDPMARFRTARELACTLEDAIGSNDIPAEAGSAVRGHSSAGHASKSIPASILVVEDDEGTLILARAVLKMHNYEVTLAKDGVDALLLLGKRSFDLVVCDVNMPNLDGFTLVDLMAKKNIPTPVIFLTSHDDVEHEVRGLELGAVDYIKKPIVPTLFAARVRRALDLGRD